MPIYRIWLNIISIYEPYEKRPKKIRTGGYFFEIVKNSFPLNSFSCLVAQLDRASSS